MELSNYYCLMKQSNILSPLSMPKPKPSTTPSLNNHIKLSVISLSKHHSRPMVVMGCTKHVPTKEVEQEDEWEGIGEGWKDECTGEGIEEVMECLEKEAIMGEDHGREPNDYNRRAHIFDKSSKVFQALKEKESNSEMLIS